MIFMAHSVCLCVNCLQLKPASDGDADGTTISSEKRMPASGPAVSTVTDGRCRPGEPLVQVRQPTADELCRPNPSELVLGFRRHRMNQQTLLPARPIAARQVRKCHTSH